MKSVGILGTGRMAVRLAVEFSKLGHKVVLGSRTPDRAAHIVEQLGRSQIRPGDYAAAAASDVILPAMFLRDGLLETIQPLVPLFSGKLYIDITNPFNSDYTDFILPWDTSGAEEIQKSFPQALVVGAFKNVWWEVFDEPEFDGSLSDVYVVSDRNQAKQDFFQLVEGMPFRFLDAGRLANARTVERMTLLSGEIGQRYRFFPRMNYKLLGSAGWKPGQADRVGAFVARA